MLNFNEDFPQDLNSVEKVDEFVKRVSTACYAEIKNYYDAERVNKSIDLALHHCATLQSKPSFPLGEMYNYLSQHLVLIQKTIEAKYMPHKRKVVTSLAEIRSEDCGRIRELIVDIQKTHEHDQCQPEWINLAPKPDDNFNDMYFEVIGTIKAYYKIPLSVRNQYLRPEKKKETKQPERIYNNDEVSILIYKRMEKWTWKMVFYGETVLHGNDYKGLRACKDGVDSFLNNAKHKDRVIVTGSGKGSLFSFHIKAKNSAIIAKGRNYRMPGKRTAAMELALEYCNKCEIKVLDYVPV